MFSSTSQDARLSIDYMKCEMNEAEVNLRKLGITQISICVLTLVFDHFRTGLVFVLRVNTILGFRN